MATRASSILECKTSFHCPDGFICAGDIYEAEHPVVQKYPERFKPLRVNRVAREDVIEQATAAPGEKRKRVR